MSAEAAEADTWSYRVAAAQTETFEQNRSDILVNIQSPGSFVSPEPTVEIRIVLTGPPGRHEFKDEETFFDLYTKDLDRLVETLQLAIAHARASGVV